MELILRQSTARPRLFMALCLSVIVVVSSLYLWMAAGASFSGLINALCTPSNNAGFGPFAGMWLAMTLAMMIPTAAPMLSTYLDIAEAAKAKSMAIVSPLVLTAGYGAVWIIFALTAAFIQWSLVVSGHSGFVDGRFAGLVLVGAGAYQFSSLKHACLSKCRMPMPYFLAHWTDRRTGVFRMGVEQGITCFGCCWPLMSLSFVAGLMNIAWMGAIGALMVLEKSVPQPKALSYGFGLGLIGAGIGMMVV
jgi:predicted metal-binding membrane protein